ncbi:alanine--tRNA ligase [ANME-1 cluster archaeon AG-394-G06]|nr:alanine--tRNA ligase [ANME-1 cluster archaeon AG-394-G06]
MNDEEYNIEYFKENELIRKKCEKCGTYYWTRDKDRKTCGDAPCDIYSFIGEPIFKERSVEQIRESFLSFFESHGHKRLKRYPVVARWRDDIYLNIASISNFQPFVTAGKVPPPANPLVISQPCIRLEDLESIGKTGRHLTAFEMMGHHAFNKRGEESGETGEIYWKNDTVRYCDEYLRQLGVDMDCVTYKEAPWVGGGNAGPSLEVITSGLELATLVFMDLKLSPQGQIHIKGQRYDKMDTYIVDTGYGLERFVWASKGSPTVYDAIFPDMIKELINAAGIVHPLETHHEIIMQNARLSGAMGRREIAKRFGISQEELKNILGPIESVYAVSDHTKCLAFMLADGIVPSNAKEGYLARLVLRRAFRMLKSLNIAIPLEELVLKQIKTLKNSFPELEESVDRIVEIVALEKSRYDGTLLKGGRIVKQLAKQSKLKAQKIQLDKLIDLYDTHGLPPEFVSEVASTQGIAVDIPENFYSLVASMHGEEEKTALEPLLVGLKEKTESIPATLKLYYDEPSALDFDAVVLDSFDDFVILDKTLFFPEGGGQPADTGSLKLKEENRTLKVQDVQEVEGVILHKIENGSGISKGSVVSGHIDAERRIAHTRHHSATHIVVCAARKVLGSHVWQAGAQKGEKRARIDVTHFKRISDAERKEIELLANRMVMEDKEIQARFEDREEAEQKYKFGIYQGGVPPGKAIRIVRIGEDEDVQACAGTHCTKTGEVGPIKILRTERIQDGIVRIEYSAGEAAVRAVQAQEELIKVAAATLKVPPEKLPHTVERFFAEWKHLKKENERLRGEIATLQIGLLKDHAKDVSGVRVIAEVLPDADTKEMMKIASQLTEDGFLTLLISERGKRASVVSSVPKHLKAEISASELVKRVCEVLGGSGGGKAEIAQGGGEKVEMVEDAIAAGIKLIQDLQK